MRFRSFADLTEGMVVGLKTTGPDFNRHRIVEIAIAQMDFTKIEPGHSQIEMLAFHTKIDPGIPIPPGTTSLCGIDDADVQGEPSFEEVAKTIYDMLSDHSIVAHDIRSIMGFINASLGRAGWPPIENSTYYCTMDRMGAYRNELDGSWVRHSLDNTGMLIGLTPRKGKQHNALSDANFTISLAGSMASEDRYSSPPPLRESRPNRQERRRKRRS